VGRCGDQSEVAESIARFEGIIDLVLSSVAHQWPQPPHQDFRASRSENSAVTGTPSTVWPAIVTVEPTGLHQLARMLDYVSISHLQFEAYLCRSAARTSSERPFALQQAREPMDPTRLVFNETQTRIERVRRRSVSRSAAAFQPSVVVRATHAAPH